MIVLLSNKGKYAVPSDLEEQIIRTGGLLFRNLEEKKDKEFAEMLTELHLLIVSKGTPIEAMKHADLVVPPIDSDPCFLRLALGIDKPKKGIY